MSHQQGEGDKSAQSTVTVTVWAYDTCKCHLSRVLPNCLNPFYQRAKRTIDAAMATSTILSGKRAQEIAEAYGCVANVEVTEHVAKTATGCYEYGQQVTYTFDAEDCDHPEEVARQATKQLVTVDHIEVV